jgi:hypothetical protein
MYLHNPHISSGAHPGAVSSEENGGGGEADHSPPSNVDVKNGGTIPPLPHTSSWRGA